MEKWIEKLPSDVYRRLAECRNKKSDIPMLVNCRWEAMVEAGKQEEGFTKEDALVDILEWLDMNSQWFDFTREEYDALKA